MEETVVIGTSIETLVAKMFAIKKAAKEGILVDKMVNGEIVIFDTDRATVSKRCGTLYFNFHNKELDNFTVDMEDIKDVKFDVIENMTISILIIDKDNAVMIHTFA